MRRAMIIAALAFITLLSACSFTTDFVVINETSQPLEVRYKLNNSSAPFRPHVIPSVMPMSELFDKGRRWVELSSSQYALNSEQRTITVVVLPNQSLRIDLVERAGATLFGEEDLAPISVDEMTMHGVRGDKKYVGEEVRRAFKKESSQVYAFRYR
jgi:hypothetical protein